MLGIQNIAASRPYHAHNPRFASSDWGDDSLREDSLGPTKPIILPGQNGQPPIIISLRNVYRGPDGQLKVRVQVDQEVPPDAKPTKVRLREDLGMKSMLTRLIPRSAKRLCFKFKAWVRSQMVKTSKRKK